MRILVVSGFLGAGKTTFITRMAQRCRKKFVVMENEMGAVDVDAGLLSNVLPDDVRVWELTEGCICCSMKTDFATSVLTIENALSPEFLLVEPTGVGMLSKILRNLLGIAYERISILSPVTILDGRAWRTTARDFPELFADQLSSAGTVVVSKTEEMDEEERRDVCARIREHAPEAEIVAHPYAAQPDEWWDGLWRRGHDGRMAADAGQAETDLENIGMTNFDPLSPGELACLLEMAVRGAFGRIVRAKGLVPSVRPGELLRFDIVDGRYAITAETGGAASAVFIGRGLDGNALFRAFRGRASGNLFQKLP